MPINKPRTRLCWVCGRKFWGNKFTIVTLEDGHKRECHKSCAEAFNKERMLDQCITTKQRS